MKSNLYCCFADIHGCFDEFQELYQKVIDFGISPDHVWSLGDLLDKGPFGSACVRFAREKGIQTINANHEHKYARWFKHVEKKRLNPSYVIPMQMNDHEMEQANQLSPEDIAWIQNLPPYKRLGHYILIHAGMYAGMKLEDHPLDKLLVIRHLDENNKSVDVNYKDIGKPMAPGVVPWYEKYSGEEHVLCGHAIVSMIRPYVHKGLGKGWVASIDNGSSAGGMLSAVVFDPANPEFALETLQVKAKQVYKPLYAPIDDPYAE